MCSTDTTYFKTEYEQLLLQEILLEVENYPVECLHRKRIESIIAILLKPPQSAPKEAVTLESSEKGRAIYEMYEKCFGKSSDINPEIGNEQLS